MSNVLDNFLIGKRPRYVATGDTYQHREEFTSWGWHWDSKRRVWIEDNGSDPDEICILAIRNLPGVVVTEEETE